LFAPVLRRVHLFGVILAGGPIARPETRQPNKRTVRRSRRRIRSTVSMGDGSVDWEGRRVWVRPG
jgi:hypothetical protein